MDENTRVTLEQLHSEDREPQNKAFFEILAATDQPFDWVYEVWGETKAG